MLLIYSKTTTRGWTSPCHPPPSQNKYKGVGATWAKLLPTPRCMLPARSQEQGAEGLGEQGALTSGRTARRPAG